MFFGILLLLGLVHSTVWASSGSSCQDVDTHSCQLFQTAKPDLCMDPAFANTMCRSFCGTCSLECYSCTDSIRDPSQCNTTTACSAGGTCVTRHLLASDGHHEYTMSCEKKSLCDGLALGFGKRNVADIDVLTRDSSDMMLVSMTCCDTDFCNYPNQTTTSTTTTYQATTTITSRPTTPVPVHWVSWSPWSACSSTCGAGVKIRSRSCRGTGCVGNFKETAECAMAICANPKPIDGAWGKWQPWGPCDRADYTTGSMERMRICDSPFPKNGGQPCPNATDFIDIDKTWCLGSQTPHCTETKINEIRVDGPWTVGGTVSLQCKTSGDPTPQIHWTIHTDENVYRFPQDPATILIVGIKRAHAGNFTCSASNNCGHVARKIYVARIP